LKSLIIQSAIFISFCFIEKQMVASHHPGGLLFACEAWHAGLLAFLSARVLPAGAKIKTQIM